MSGIWGRRLKISLFGESHGGAIGVTIHGLPGGFRPDLEEIRRHMARRRPGQSRVTTSRQEADAFEIVSGFFEEKTTGTPLTCLIRNQDQKSAHYETFRHVVRPGHGDWPGKVKYNRSEDFRGGGHFSGRITAPLVFAGSLVRQLLEKEGIRIGAHMEEVAGIRDGRFQNAWPDAGLLDDLTRRPKPLLNGDLWPSMEEAIMAARRDGDSVGGVVECAATGVPAGLGDPFFDSLESCLATLLFSIPAVKGLEFGDGFGLAGMRGSQSNDPYGIRDGRVETLSNHNGGITGGISNGAPVVFRVAIKATPSISLPQKTVDLERMEETTLVIEGRHDPCIVPRAVPVVEAAAALALYDALESER